MRTTPIVTILCLLALVAIGTLAWRHAEPRWEGRPLSAWVYDLSTPGASPFVLTAVQKVGTNGLPMLLRWIQYENVPATGVRMKLVKWLEWPPIKRFSKKPRQWLTGEQARRRRAYASTALAHLGAQAAPATPSLSAMAKSADHLQRALLATELLGHIGNPVPAMAELITNAPAPVKRQALETVSKLGPIAAPAIPTIIRAIDDPDCDVSAKAVIVLGDLKLEPDLCVPALVRSFHKIHSRAQVMTTRSLMQFGCAARPYVPQIADLLIDANLDEQKLIHLALEAILAE